MTTKGLGWIPSTPDQRDQVFAAVLPRVTMPKIANVPLSHFPGVYDQGQLGSCTAQGTGAIFAFTLKQEKFHVIKPSRLFIYYNARLMRGSEAYDSGASIRDAVKSLKTYGTCLEKTWPYKIDKFSVVPSPKLYAEGLKPENTVIQYQSVPQDLNAIKSAIIQKTPIVFGFTVYDSFYSNAWPKIMPMPSLREGVLGGHCTVIVGYNDDLQCVYVRNSWGTGWKDKGYFYMPYSYVLNPRLASDFWVILSTGKAEKLKAAALKAKASK